jgi:3-hydroxyacyl-CoA dehydrogenase / 3-hydroxy-2-methylbutyryl-CoA dehydrogenase
LFLEGKKFAKCIVSLLNSCSSSGLGLATVESLLASKAFVAVLDVAGPPASLSATSTKFFELDITDVEQVEKVVEDVVSWTKQTGAALGGVINCAGVGLPTKIVEWKDGKTTPHSLDVWNFVIGINLTGTFNLTRLVLNHLIKVEPEGEDGERGIVIMVSSAAAVCVTPHQSILC